MEIKGATLLYTLAGLMITFAGFSALLLARRGTRSFVFLGAPFGTRFSYALLTVMSSCCPCRSERRLHGVYRHLSPQAKRQFCD